MAALPLTIQLDGQKAHGTPMQQQSTTGFFAFRPNAWPNGPGVLASFGMGGVETLVFNHLLRSRKEGTVAAVLRKQRSAFMIVDFTIPEIASTPLDLHFTERVLFVPKTFFLGKAD